MPRGTKKRNFKKNKTRNNKKLRNTRRLKKGNKSKKRKQRRTQRRRKKRGGMFSKCFGRGCGGASDSPPPLPPHPSPPPPPPPSQTVIATDALFNEMKRINIRITRYNDVINTTKYFNKLKERTLTAANAADAEETDAEEAEEAKVMILKVKAFVANTLAQRLKNAMGKFIRFEDKKYDNNYLKQGIKVTENMLKEDWWQLTEEEKATAGRSEGVTAAVSEARAAQVAMNDMMSEFNRAKIFTPPILTEHIYKKSALSDSLVPGGRKRDNNEPTEMGGMSNHNHDDDDDDRWSGG
tara:strand:- start:1020 stop:1904 length:885 start_codon:yes stop_codon:yes gene_type:complete